MGIRIVWDDEEKTIMRHIHEGTWTLEEYYAHLEQTYNFIEEVGHKVYIINDLRAMTDLPKDVAIAVRRAARKAHPNEALNVFVGASAYVNLLVDTVYSAVEADVTPLDFVNTLEEAYAIIEAHKQQH